MSATKVNYPKIGICGLSCRLCPMYHTQTKSRCLGCKSKARVAVGCPFITCAIKRRGIEFCWECQGNEGCAKWKKHREAGKDFDSFKCYQRLEDNIAFIQEQGIQEFREVQKTREALLKDMLRHFNEGRSKSYYCIAATILEVGELETVLARAKQATKGLGIKEKSKTLHSLIDDVAQSKNYYLRLRK